MDIINLEKIIYDSGLIMAIIAINMTIIGLTSLADFKKVIGVDYGTFLIKKYKLFSRLTIYHVLIIFAVINVTSLFLMFIDHYIFRIVNFSFLILSLIFAIYYFFTFIIIDNRSVRKQIYQMELEGIYIHSENKEHHVADVLTKMNSGSSCPKKVSSNLVEYFNTYNDETLLTFKEIFGPNSLLYDDGRKRKKRYRNNYQAKPYKYRMDSNAVGDISFEFLQFLRTNNLADKWSLEILRLLNGKDTEQYNQLRLYNLTRLITQINLFISTGGIYQYKFLQHIKPYYYQAVAFNGKSKIEIEMRKVEKYAFKQLLQLCFAKNECKNVLFYEFAEVWFVEMISGDGYKGLLSKHDLVSIMLAEVHTYDTPEYKKVFAEVVSAYQYQFKDDTQIIPLHEIRAAIKNKPVENSEYAKIPVHELFGMEERGEEHLFS